MVKTQKVKPKMTKEERRAKYTKQARDRRDKASKTKAGWNKICFHCRRKGHMAADCRVNPENSLDSNRTTQRNSQICYKCGSDEHGLKKCPKLTADEKKDAKAGRMDYNKMDLPFAICFICKEKGHLSSQCEQNENGVYVKGRGCCKECGSKYHLHLNCPDKKKKDEEQDKDNDSAGDVEEYLEEEQADKSVQLNSSNAAKSKKKKVINF
jgi:hypothetical protein